MGNSSATGRSNQGHSHESSWSQTTFKWKIGGFSSLLDKGNGWTYSNVFQIGGLNWYLKVNPRDTKSGSNKEYVSLNLELAPQCVGSGTVVEASFKFLIYDQIHGKHHEQHQVSHRFQSTSTTYGTSCMIPLMTLKNKSSGFLVNNCCVFGVEFTRIASVKGHQQFSNNGTSWGWSNFSSGKNFVNSSNGYVVKTECCIEAQSFSYSTKMK